MTHDIRKLRKISLTRRIFVPRQIIHHRLLVKAVNRLDNTIKLKWTCYKKGKKIYIDKRCKYRILGNKQANARASEHLSI